MYATQTDMEQAFTLEQLMLAAGTDEMGALLTERVQRALVRASGEIDGYVGTKYELPLSTVPEILKGYCCDIAMYRLGTEYGQGLTEEKSKRYDDAISRLKDIARGLMSLGLPARDVPDSSVGDPIIVSGERRFSRKSMRGLL